MPTATLHSGLFNTKSTAEPATRVPIHAHQPTNSALPKLMSVNILGFIGDDEHSHAYPYTNRLLGLASPAYLRAFPFSGLLSIEGCCVAGGVRMVHPRITVALSFMRGSFPSQSETRRLGWSTGDHPLLYPCGRRGTFGVSVEEGPLTLTVRARAD